MERDSKFRVLVLGCEVGINEAFVDILRQNGYDADSIDYSPYNSPDKVFAALSNQDEYVQQLSEAGAAGYLLKQTAASELIKAIREAKKGNAFYSPVISKRLIEHYRETLLRGVPVKKRADQLTSRQAEVLQLIAEGKPNKQIAADMSVSIKTVQNHRQQLMNKLHIHDIAGLTRYAISKGIIEGRSPGHQAALAGGCRDKAAPRQPTL